ncbi:MAG: phage tail protein [Flavobacterium sp.]|nr:MAG: phage tail protein [Flavobacterium sp.]
MEGTIGEIRYFAGNFPPTNWAFCNGAAFNMDEYEALYTIIGNTYGGDGVSTFKVPDLQGRAAVGTGQGAGLPNVQLGQIGGTEMATMTSAQMPAHNHAVSIDFNIPAYSQTNPGQIVNSVLEKCDGAYSEHQADTSLAPMAVPLFLNATGAGVPFSIMQPSLAMNYIICLVGIYPSRNY